MAGGFNKFRWLLIPVLLGVTVFFLRWPGAAVPDGPDSPGEREMEFEPLSAKAVTVLGCGIDETGMLTDVIILGSFDLETDRISLLQIPRDTYIGDGYVTGKINAVYGHPKGDSGIQELKTLVEKQLQLPIDYTATITLSGLRSMVDAMGGVEVEVPFQMEYLPGMVLEEGKQRLNGEQAEWFIRYRKGYATGDIGRLGAQKEFLHGVLDAVRREGRLKSIQILLDHAGEVKTDLPLGQMASLANRAYQVPDSGVEFYLLPGRGTYHNGYSVYEADREALADLLNEAFRPVGEEVPPSQLEVAAVPLPPPEPEEPASEEEQPIEESAGEGNLPGDLIENPSAFPTD